MITLDGQNQVRHFVVTNGGTLRLINVQLRNGYAAGPQGETDEDGQPGFGGSILNSGGNLELMSCQFMSNQVVGGLGGPPGDQAGIGRATRGGAGYGGAIYSVNGQVRADGGVFVNNSARGGKGSADQTQEGGNGGEAFGGAICGTNGTVVLAGVTLTGNQALSEGGVVGAYRGIGSGGPAHGGAIASLGTMAVLSNCVITANKAEGSINFVFSFPLPLIASDAEGGGLYQDGGNVRIVSSYFQGNLVKGAPGGIFRSNYPGVGATGKGGAVFALSGLCELDGSTFASNEAAGGVGYPVFYIAGKGGAGLGGAIHNRATMTLVNCTLAENHARGGEAITITTTVVTGHSQPGYGSGGAIYNEGRASLVNVTLAGNTAQFGQGPESAPAEAGYGSSIANESGLNGFVRLTNCVLACEAALANVAEPVIDGGHNLCSDGSAGFSMPTSRNNVQPLLGPLAYNGGLTPTVALLPGSPAIDAGDDAACPPTDQRSVLRPQGVACDIGAFELTPQLTLTRRQAGAVDLTCQFVTGYTNRFSASTNLQTWLPLGSAIADTNGVSKFEDPAAAQFSRRFFKVELGGKSEN